MSWAGWVPQFDDTWVLLDEVGDLVVRLTEAQVRELVREWQDEQESS